jgi:hypothetical protein
MKHVTLSVTDLVVLQNLRTIVGASVGLLVATRLTQPQRKAAAFGMLLASVAVGVPFAMGFVAKLRSKATAVELPARSRAEPAKERIDLSAQAV